MKYLFLLITLSLIPICLPYDPPVIESVVADEGKVSSSAPGRVHDAALPSPLATEEAKVANPKPLNPSDREIALLVKQFSWDYSTAIRLAKSENAWNWTKSFDCSRTNTNTNGSTDYGLFQINDIHTRRVAKHGWNMEDMKDCYKNAIIAYEIYSEQSWNPWYAYKNGSYLTHSVIEL